MLPQGGNSRGWHFVCAPKSQKTLLPTVRRDFKKSVCVCVCCQRDSCRITHCSVGGDPTPTQHTRTELPSCRGECNGCRWGWGPHKGEFGLHRRVRTTPARSAGPLAQWSRAAGAMEPGRSPNPESVPSKSMEYHGGEPPKTIQNDRKMIQKIDGF